MAWQMIAAERCAVPARGGIRQNKIHEIYMSTSIPKRWWI